MLLCRPLLRSGRNYPVALRLAERRAAAANKEEDRCEERYWDLFTSSHHNPEGGPESAALIAARAALWEATKARLRAELLVKRLKQ
jgi:hypothetical protein